MLQDVKSIFSDMQIKYVCKFVLSNTTFTFIINMILFTIISNRICKQLQMQHFCLQINKSRSGPTWTAHADESHMFQYDQNYNFIDK